MRGYENIYIEININNNYNNYNNYICFNKFEYLYIQFIYYIIIIYYYSYYYSAQLPPTNEIQNPTCKKAQTSSEKERK